MAPSSRRRQIAALLLTSGLLLAATASAAPPDRLETRARLADALYLESGMGDLRGALVIYQDISRMQGVAGDLTAEALLRQGLAHAALGEPQEAETAWLRLMELHPSSSRAGDARLHLDRLERERSRITSLPAVLGFDRDLGGLLHARSLSDRGQLEQLLTELDGELEGVAAWRTWVAAGQEDVVSVGFATGLTLQGDIELEIRTGSFPAHLVIELVDEDERSFASLPIVVTPEQGPLRIELSAGTLRDRGETWTPGAAAARLEIHDVTGRRSTDRGENLILLDDLAAW